MRELTYKSSADASWVPIVLERPCTFLGFQRLPCMSADWSELLGASCHSYV